MVFFSMQNLARAYHFGKYSCHFCSGTQRKDFPGLRSNKLQINGHTPTIFGPLVTKDNSFIFLTIFCRLSPKFQVDVCTKFIAATVLLLKELQNAAFHTLLVSQSLNGKKPLKCR